MDRANRLILAGLLTGFVCLSSSNAHAQFPWGHGNQNESKERGFKEQQLKEVYDQLGLSEEQKKLLEDNKTKHKDQGDALRADLKSAMQAMGDELKREDLDSVKIDALRAKLKTLRDQMADERFNAILEVRKILTHDQFAKFIQLIEEKKSHNQAHD